MKLTLLFVISATLAGAAYQPTQSDLDAAVLNASKQWGTQPAESVNIRIEMASACGILKSEQRNSLAHPSELSEAAAITNLVEYREVYEEEDSDSTVSTIVYEGGGSEQFKRDGSSSSDGAPVVSASWVILINGTCNFWTPDILRQFVLHEYGHTLRLQHSRDEHSIMYWLVFLPPAAKKFGSQSITDVDRMAARSVTIAAK